MNCHTRLIALGSAFAHTRLRVGVGWGVVLLVMRLGLVYFADHAPSASQAVPTDPQPYIRSPYLGIAHISAPEGGTGDLRYQQALAMGAGWNRFPIYWNQIETAPNDFGWTRYDIQVADDLRYNLHINAILLGRPEFYAADLKPNSGDRHTIVGLDEPIFADGSDQPAPNKPINPNNPWARFVYEAVNRYKPNGVLAQQGALAAGMGVRVWEIWNEPDLPLFWRGGIPAYARLLKVAYLAAHAADPDADVMVGGLTFNTETNWLAQLLALYSTDPLAAQHQQFMDLVAVHNYADPWRTGWLVHVVKETLKTYQQIRPIWVTETGVPVWDDYPGATWAVSSSKPDQIARAKRATQQQQAWFVIQSAVYAWVEGADVVIFHQLYDDCGDQAPGTNFPPHNGQLCVSGAVCSGDAHGFFRNSAMSVCFSQHPQPGTPRYAARAYKLLANVFAKPFEDGKYLTLDPNAVVIEFRRPLVEERIVVMWSRKLTPVTLRLPAEGTNAQLITLDASSIITPNDDGEYSIQLPAAQPDDTPNRPAGTDAAIGGAPSIVIERRNTSIEPLLIDLDLDVRPTISTPSPALTRAPGSIFDQPATPAPSLRRPTVDPQQDQTPPQATILPLPITSPPIFTVTWSGQDDSGIRAYIVWVRVDDGAWEVWLNETPTTYAEFIGQSGRVYAFDVWAVDLAGNWSENLELLPRAITRVEG